MSASVVCMFIHHLHAWYPRKPEKGIEFLELELQRVMSHLVISGNPSPWKNNNYSWQRIHLSSPDFGVSMYPFIAFLALSGPLFPLVLADYFLLSAEIPPNSSFNLSQSPAYSVHST